MIELNLTRKDFFRFFLERRFRWGNPTVGLFTVYLRTVLRTPGLKPWPVQRPNPIADSMHKKIDITSKGGVLYLHEKIIYYIIKFTFTCWV